MPSRDGKAACGWSVEKIRLERETGPGLSPCRDGKLVLVNMGRYWEILSRGVDFL